MGFKLRGYNKEETNPKTRDYSLFVIACEGTKREPEYFRPFDGIDRIKVDIIGNKPGHRDSAPKKVLERALEYIEEVGLSKKDGDSLWFIIDVDNWPREQIEEVAVFCTHNPNWNLIISNPCFEIWLLYHTHEDLSSFFCPTPKEAKAVLNKLEKGGYQVLKYLPLLENAVKNAKKNDTNPNHYYPNPKETKVYVLGEAILKRIGKPHFESFIARFIPPSNSANKKVVKTKK